MMPHTLKEYNEYCNLRNYSVMLNSGIFCGFKAMDYRVKR